MQLEEFTKNLAEQFEDADIENITPDTSYKNIKGWSSMYALIIIAFVDEYFNVILSGTDLKSAETIRDLYTIVTNKK